MQKNNYFHKQFIENRNNIRETWKLINKITGSKSENNNDTLLKSFKNESLLNITENFARNFNQNVLNIVHQCSIITLNLKVEKIFQN